MKDIHYVGDGSNVLRIPDEQPCSDEEWELLKSNVIPEKFLK
jgi:hypothetical protein